MPRITNRSLYDNTLTNIWRQNEGLMRVQEELASGKRVNRASDDPVSMGEILRYQSRLNRNDKYQTLAKRAEMFLNTSESYIGSATELATRAKELALGQVGGGSGAQTRRITAQEVGAMAERAIEIGNARIGTEYIFSGRKSDTAAISQSGFYQGDHTEMQAAIDENATVGMSVRASEFIAADMAPVITAGTPITALRDGQGISTGTFTITDRAGGTGSVTVSSVDTVSTVLAAINASGANVTASLTADGNGIQITDNNSAVTGPLVIADATGTAAADLGLAGSRALSTVTSTDVSPAVTSATALADLYGGNGIQQGSISIVNGTTSATISLATLSTVGDVINAVNLSFTSTTASINTAGTALQLTSTDPNTVAYAVDNNNGTAAEQLGIGGGRNLVLTLQRLEQAMLLNDQAGISGLIQNLGTNIDSVTALRGTVGARQARVSSTLSTLDKSTYDTTTLLSNVQDADLAKSASDLALLQVAQQATVKASASILQPSLLDFIR